jgi:multicomponent Na+:H+ antiporter subunit G
LNVADFLTIGLLAAGALFILIGGIGLIRFPDFYTRAHAAGIGDTLGIMLVILGLMLQEGLTQNSLKMLFILLFLLLTNPAATHALLQAAFRFRLRPWFAPEKEK